MNHKLLFVEWLDHCSAGSYGKWVDKGDIEKAGLQKITTVGWLFSEDKKELKLVSQHDDDWETFGGHVTIAKSCIVKRKVINL
jgi:hypothetical protein